MHAFGSGGTGLCCYCREVHGFGVGAGGGGVVTGDVLRGRMLVAVTLMVWCLDPQSSKAGVQLVQSFHIGVEFLVLGGRLDVERIEHLMFQASL